MSRETRHVNAGLRKLCTCPRRVWAKCPHAWYLNFKPRGGAAFRLSIDKHLNRHVDSKSDAEREAEAIRRAIREGRFGQPAPRAEMTLRELVALYLERYVDVERADTAADFRGGLRVVCDTPVPHPAGGTPHLGDWRLSDIVTDTVERYREIRRANGTGPGGANRSLSRLRAVFNWGIRTGYLEGTPFARYGQAIVTFSDEHPRTRRLDVATDEEERLLAACGPHLRAIVEAALETGMRSGEILSLQWSQVEGITVDRSKVTWGPRAELVLPWRKTKTRRARRIPISTRLRAILELRRFDPAGQPLPLSAYVFGNALGQQVKGIKRAWATAVLTAHGLPVERTGTMNLAPASRAELARIGLHFHDLRREAGSRWLEGGVPLHTVRDWLGHANISQTSGYLTGTVTTQHDAMTAYEQRRADLQRIATGSRKGGRKSPRPAEAREKKTNKTAVGREPAIM